MRNALPVGCDGAVGRAVRMPCGIGRGRRRKDDDPAQSCRGNLYTRGRRLSLLPATHIVEEDEPYFFKAAAGDHLTDGSQMQEAAQVFSDQIRGKMDCFGQVWTGMPATGGKFCGLPDMFLDQIWKLDIPVLIEADGAKKKPLKVPAGHEPVIHPRTTMY